MPSSTSNSDRRRPLAWSLILSAALLALIACVAAMEAGLALRGFRPTVLDSEPLWLKQRTRAAELGRRALILVGGSRMQLDMDQDVLRRMTGLEPVQLAIDGVPFTGVFRGLAQDPHITGTVLVDFTANGVATPEEFERINSYETDAERLSGRHNIPNFSLLDAELADMLHHALLSYADNASPLANLRRNLLDSDATPQYLITLPDRSTLADYQRVQLPAFYYKRVIRNLGENLVIPPGTTPEQADALLKARVEAVRPLDPTYFHEHIGEIAAMAAAITARGGKVIFVMFPESGYVREIDARLYPRREFWDAFAAVSGVQTLNYEDVPALAALRCPDGSHLDYRDRERFTETLVSALRLGSHLPY